MKNKNKNVIKISTFIDSSTKVTGDIFSENNIKIDGTIDGNIISLKDVVISETGIVNGTIKANSTVIDGTVTGNIVTNETVTLSPKGKIEGDIKSIGLIADIGSIFEGKCSIANNALSAKNVIAPAVFEIAVPDNIENKTEIHSEQNEFSTSNTSPQLTESYNYQ